MDKDFWDVAQQQTLAEDWKSEDRKKKKENAKKEAEKNTNEEAEDAAKKAEADEEHKVAKSNSNTSSSSNSNYVSQVHSPAVASFDVAQVHYGVDEDSEANFMKDPLFKKTEFQKEGQV